MNDAVKWLQTLGVAGFIFFLLKGTAWLVVFWLISRGVIRKHKLAKRKLRLRNLGIVRPEHSTPLQAPHPFQEHATAFQGAVDTRRIEVFSERILGAQQGTLLGTCLYTHLTLPTTVIV